MSEQIRKAFEATFQRDWEDPNQAGDRHVFTLGFEAALATQPQAQQGAVPDLRGVDGGTVDEWLDLIAHRLVKRDTVLIRAVDAPKAMTPYERRAAPETPEGQK